MIRGCVTPYCTVMDFASVAHLWHCFVFFCLVIYPESPMLLNLKPYGDS